jgi:glycerophosphoryl diester phosphodiesterase
MIRALPLLLALALASQAWGQAETRLPNQLQGALRVAEGTAPFGMVRAVEGDDYGGLLVLDAEEAVYRRLILRRAEAGWELEVRGQVRQGSPRGGAVESVAESVGDDTPQAPRNRTAWRWGEPERVPLSSKAAGLVGGGYALQDPDALATADVAQLALSLPLGEAPQEQGRQALVIGHRGLPTEHPENTIPSLEAAIAAGANGVEIDLCLTRDGEVVLWHDSSTGGLVSLVRNLGFEGGMAYMPNYPPLGSGFRRPVHELSLAELRAHYGYSPRRFTLGDLDPEEGIHIPTLDEAGPVLARLDVVVLDVKVPETGLIPRFAKLLDAALRRHDLAEKTIVLHPDADLVDALAAALPSRYPISHDIEILRVWGGGDPEDYSAVMAARARRLRVCSIGRPRLMLWGGWKLYSGILRHDRALIDASGADILQLAWTLNDEDELREAWEIGVDGIVTDDPALARRTARRAGR